MDKIEITIAIPAYKNVKTLTRAIESIEALEDSDISFQIYVSVDYSENTNDVIQLLNSKHIYYTINNPALGMAANWNNCIKNAKTNYVALLHDDDYLLPNYVKAVKTIIKSLRNWDCVVFGHLLESNGVISENRVGGGLKQIMKKHTLNKVRKVSYIEYWIGGYNSLVIPTCGILFNRNTFLKTGGYSSDDGYSVDDIFMERNIRNGYRVFYYNDLVSVYTYTTNYNLSSNHDVKRSFVLENIEHRKNVADKSCFWKLFNDFFNECVTLHYVGQWKEYLIPELEVNLFIKIKYFVYKLIVKIYRILICLKFKKI